MVLFDQAKRTERRKTKKRKEYRTFVLPGESETFSFRTGFEYDSWNRLRTMTYPDNEKVEYLYDLGGQLTEVYSYKSGDTMTYIENISYNKFGQRDAIFYGNGTHALYSYDILQRLTNLRSYDANNEMMQDIDYVFDPVGNIMDVTNYAVALQNGLGGEYDYHYTYDDLYRLVESTGNGGNNTYYNMDMAYTPNGKIEQKKVGAVGEFNGGQQNIDMSYEYSYFEGSNKLQHVYDGAASYDRYFSWDLNGNMLLNDKGHTQQRHCWDEENRLIMTKDAEHAAHYMYDANGERVYKVTGDNFRMNINGRDQDIYAALYNPTLYASPYVVASPQGYTKHYYAGAERIASRIGGGGLSDLRDPVVDVTDKLNNMIDRVDDGWQPHCFCFSLHEMEMLIENLGDEEINRLEELEMFVECLKNEYRVDFKTEMHLFFEYEDIFHNEPDIYFYHPDHLGSSSWITDQDGEAIQHLQYLPFGEQYIDQRTTGWDAMFTFSGKERDQETGYSYFGARYYDSDLSIWLSVDPLAGKYPHQSNYVYCSNNPIRLIDPDGMDEWDINESGKITWKNNNGGNDNHSLHAVANGDRTGESISVTDKTILTSLQDGGKTAETSNATDAFKVFKFAADNSTPEWSLKGYKTDNATGFLLSTSYDPEGVSSGHGNFNPSDMFFSLHSHPDGKDNQGPSGYATRCPGCTSWVSDLGPSDVKTMMSDIKVNNKSNHFIYHKGTKNLIFYNIHTATNKQTQNERGTSRGFVSSGIEMRKKITGN